MKSLCLVLLLMISLHGLAQTQSGLALTAIRNIKYTWKTPAKELQKNISATTLFEGTAHDFEYLQMEAVSLTPSKHKTMLQVADNEEHLFLIKSGSMKISFRDSVWSIGPGSIALLMPGEKYSLQNAQGEELLFYRMKYRSKTPVDASRGKSGGGSLVKDWNKIPFTAHNRGGVRRYFERSTAMCKRFEMHVTTLNAGLTSHAPHTHRAEEIVLLLEDTHASKGKAEMQIGDKFFEGEAGDIYFLGSNVLHGIRNTGSEQCSYFAFQFE